MKSDTIRRIASWTRLLLVITACLLLTLIIRRYPQTPGERPPEVSIKTDTVTTRDTLYIPAPQPTNTKSLGFIPVTMPTWKPTENLKQSVDPTTEELTTEADNKIETEPPDSIAVAIPIEQKHYKGDDYDAWVSGWNPSLDSLHIYRQTQQIATTTEITRWKTRRWGLSVGVGAVASPKGGIQPGIFVGATYTFLVF